MTTNAIESLKQKIETHSCAMNVSIIECFGSQGYQENQIKTFSLGEYISNSCFISN